MSASFSPQAEVLEQNPWGLRQCPQLRHSTTANSLSALPALLFHALKLLPVHGKAESMAAAVAAPVKLGLKASCTVVPGDGVTAAASGMPALACASALMAEDALT